MALYRQIAPHVGVAKVGLSLFVEHGPLAVEAFLDEGAQVFLDLKLHDIPNTVALAAERAARLGASYLTVHASGGAAMLKAAVEGAQKGSGEVRTRVLAVTVLTSLDAAALAETGVAAAPDAQAERLALLAKQAGVDGLVCSAREAARLRAVVGPGVLLCTPGIRPIGSDANDQARAETPEAAVAAGADLLVVGRPIYAAKDPVAAAAALARAVAAK